MKRFLPVVLAVAASLTECSNTPETCDASCTDGSTAPPISGGGCDSSKPLSQGGCAVDDSDGVFVSPTGSDAANGSKITPLLTIQKGINTAAATPLKPNVYVCTGTYPENLVVQHSPAGVGIHGGFDCTSWAQNSLPTTVSPKYVTSATPQYVIHVLGVAALIEAMTLVAPNATDPGVSSIAAYLDGSPGTTFRRATVNAGKAANGISPAALAALGPNTSGNDGTGQVGGASPDCPCSTDHSIGGQGGNGQDSGLPTNGTPIVNGNLDAGAAGTPATPAGTNGADGLVGTTGLGTGTYGELTTNGWTASAGGAGVTGGTAQGGGGACWHLGATTGGGSGACGGCGGKGGAGGGGGGASIGLGALNTTLRIQATTIIANKAGDGGNGTSGQPGQPGGTGGTCSPSCGWYGGNGGTGGNGGASGGGAGGISVAIATFNTKPDIDLQSTVLAGAAGLGGHDGTVQALKAIDGIAAAVHSF